MKTIPYHIEAKKLGVKNFNEIKKINPYRLSANEIREIWDYKKAGLKVEEARANIFKWGVPWKSYHRFSRGEKQDTRMDNVIHGRIKELDHHIKFMRQQYKTLGLVSSHCDFVALHEATQFQDSSAPTWSSMQSHWKVGDRSIITTYQEDITWSSNRRNHYPESTKIYYISHLIRQDFPSAKEFIATGYCNARSYLTLATEKTFTHSIRGNWRNKVAKELLGIDFKYEEPWNIYYKQVAKTSEGKLVSIYDGSEYIIGKVRKERAKEGHEGGLYCYRTQEEATWAEFPPGSKCKHLPRVLLQVKGRGRKVAYEIGKIAVSEMLPVKVEYLITKLLRIL
jgi:hypothetical protein